MTGWWCRPGTAPSRARRSVAGYRTSLCSPMSCRAGTATFLDDLAAARPRVAGMGRLGAGLAVPFSAGRDVEGVLVGAGACQRSCVRT